MSKQKSITQLVNDLQEENESLKRLERLANSYTKQEFGYSVKELHQIIAKATALEAKIKRSSGAMTGEQVPAYAQHKGGGARGGQKPLPDQP